MVTLEVVLDERENNWTRATPVEARTSEVRTYARKVLSDARWSLATEPLFSSVRLIRMVLGKEEQFRIITSVVGRKPFQVVNTESLVVVVVASSRMVQSAVSSSSLAIREEFECNRVLVGHVGRFSAPQVVEDAFRCRSTAYGRGRKSIWDISV